MLKKKNLLARLTSVVTFILLFSIGAAKASYAADPVVYGTEMNPVAAILGSAIGIIGIIVLFIILILPAREAGKIAALKGYSSTKWFWMCFIFSIIGYILVAALPDKGKDNRT